MPIAVLLGLLGASGCAAAPAPCPAAAPPATTEPRCPRSCVEAVAVVPATMPSAASTAQARADAPAASAAEREGTTEPAPVQEATGKIDLFVLADVQSAWVEIDGFPGGQTPVRTFLLESGDHIVRVSAGGFPSCRFTLRAMAPGESWTLRADLTTADSRGCGRIRRLEGPGKLADP